MAKHLVSRDLGTGSGAARYPLIADGSHLVVMYRNSHLTNAELVVTPSDERYLKGASWGYSTSYNDNIYSSSLGELNTLAGRLKTMRANATLAQWATGHAYMFNYCARSFAPYALRTSIANLTDWLRTLEFGTSWHALKFNVYGIPLGSGFVQAANNSNPGFKAYWRIWNPSNLQSFTFDFTGVGHCECWNTTGEDASSLCYHFDADLCAPSQCVASGYGTVNLPSVANESTANGTTTSNEIRCDPFGSSTCNRAFAVQNYAKQLTYAYAKPSAALATQYHVDVEITGTQLAALKNACANGTFWAHFGFKLGNMGPVNSGFFAPYSTMHTQCSRIELVLKGTFFSFNNT